MYCRPHTVLSAICLLLLPLLSGCSEYWWSRGQPPAVTVLIQRSGDRLSSSLNKYGQKRELVASLASEISGFMRETLGGFDSPSRVNQTLKLNQNLAELRNRFIQLEGKLSIGSRPALAELSGQLRRFSDQVKQGKSVDPDAFGLFTARTQFFLARELLVEAPNFG